MIRKRIRVYILPYLAAIGLLSTSISVDADEIAGSLRAAILELEEMFGDDYPGGHFLSELDVAERGGDIRKMRALRKTALLKENPLLKRHPLLFVTRKQYRRDHHNTATLFEPGEINDHKYETEGELKLLDLGEDAVRTVFDPGPGATVRDPEVGFDGERILFSMRRGKADSYHIYSINADGSGLRQLTSAPGVSDIDPLWLPGGDIVFSSSRDPKYCMCNRHIMVNLYRMEGDGANIHQIGKSTLFEGHSALMPDGRILYDRWEYVDRNFGDAQGLWVCNPDGTGHALYWGNNTASPGGVIDARPLSSSDRAIAVLAACHDRPWGALGIIDRSKGVDGREPVVHTWPQDFRGHISTEGFGKWDSTKNLPLKYEDPWPLTDRHFLCARQTGNGEETAIYYLDMHGNEVLVHSEAPACYDPMPLCPRPTPPQMPSRRNFKEPKAKGAFYLQNVYVGTHMEGVEPGSVKYLRIVESPEKRNWTDSAWFGQGTQAPAMNWHNFVNKKILGTVAVEEDGSAYFEVPANTFVFFQALDENKMMVQSMRSGIFVQPGETYGCIGCHENRVDAPPANPFPKALTRKADSMDGWYGPARCFSFQKEVQPVLDRNCISCHDYGKDAGRKLNLAGDRDIIFNTAYTDLWSQEAIDCIGAGPAQIQQAYSWGSHASRLISVLRGGHQALKLCEEDMNRLITWVDLNAPYYPSYSSAYPGNPAGRSPLTSAEIRRLEKISGKEIRWKHSSSQRAMLSFERPEKSRILDGLSAGSDAWKESVELIRKGAQRLRERPRADMDQFLPCEIDRKREALAIRRDKREAEIYRAIQAGEKVYDPGIE